MKLILGSKKKIVSFRILRPNRGQNMRFAGRKIRFQGVRDLLCDLALNLQDVLKLTVIAFRPEMRVGIRINQLHIYPNFVTGPLHRSLEDGGNAELLRHSLEIVGFALILRSRGARNDLEITDRS